MNLPDYSGPFLARLDLITSRFPDGSSSIRSTAFDPNIQLGAKKLGQLGTQTGGQLRVEACTGTTRSTIIVRALFGRPGTRRDGARPGA